jgi:hypothetical protein
LSSPEYKENFKGPVICLSVSSKDTYRRTGNQHPVLGVEYQPDGESLTEQYFAKMGLQVRYFMPENSVAPFAFFFTGDLLSDYTIWADRHHQHDGDVPENLSPGNL